MSDNTPSKQETRDELSIAHAELAMAHSTIKNLSEVVVNFSHANFGLTQQVEEEMTPLPTSKQTTCNDWFPHSWNQLPSGRLGLSLCAGPPVTGSTSDRRQVMRILYHSQY